MSGITLVFILNAKVVIPQRLQVDFLYAGTY